MRTTVSLQKAIVAVARRLLIVVWQAFSERSEGSFYNRVPDRFGEPEKIAASMFAHA